MMDTYMIAIVMASGAALGIAVWVLAKVGKALIKIAELSAIAQAPLDWADTRINVTAQAWRVPRGEPVHLSVTGLLPGGAVVLVYGGLPTGTCGLGADLAPDATTTIPLPMLRHAASVEEARV